MDLGLYGKVALITGGSDGIGKAAALSIAYEGASVVICARRPAVLEKAAQEIMKKSGGTVIPIQADVTKVHDLEALVNETVQRLGRIDILVNNAGTSAAWAFEEVSDESWEKDMDLKLYAAIRLARLVAPHMRNVGGGRIINVTALGGKTPGHSSVPTSVARAAGIALTKALSKDMAAYNILVNTVCIGLIKSGQHEKRYEHARQQETTLSLDQFYQRGSTSVPLMRFGDSQEAGDVICFVASERASYLTGTSINIDGGSCSVT